MEMKMKTLSKIFFIIVIFALACNPSPPKRRGNKKASPALELLGDNPQKVFIGVDNSYKDPGAVVYYEKIDQIQSNIIYGDISDVAEVNDSLTSGIPKVHYVHYRYLEKSIKRTIYVFFDTVVVDDDEISSTTTVVANGETTTTTVDDETSSTTTVGHSTTTTVDGTTTTTEGGGGTTTTVVATTTTTAVGATTTTTVVGATTTTTVNHPPVAGIVYDSTVLYIVDDTMLVVDLSGSSDPDGDPLAHSLTVVNGPNGSEDIVIDEGEGIFSFVPSVPGNYTFEGIVNDGDVDSEAVYFTIAVENYLYAYIKARELYGDPPVIQKSSLARATNTITGNPYLFFTLPGVARYTATNQMVPDYSFHWQASADGGIESIILADEDTTTLWVVVLYEEYLSDQIPDEDQIPDSVTVSFTVDDGNTTETAITTITLTED